MSDLQLSAEEPGLCRVVSAEVQGTQFDASEVTVFIRNKAKGGLSIDSECTCPMAVDCKHAAALILEALEAYPALFQFEASKPAVRSLPPDMQGWFEPLQRAAAPAPPDANVYPTDEPQRLLYVLDLASQYAPARVIVKGMTARLLKSGKYSESREYNLGNIVNTPQPARFVRPVDVALVRKLHLISTAHIMGGHPIQGSDGAELLRELLATGRCHWRGTGKKHPPLSFGEARPARLTWITEPDGCQRPSLAVTPAARTVLPLAPPWYVDEDAGLCGPLETGLPPTVAET